MPPFENEIQLQSYSFFFTILTMFTFNTTIKMHEVDAAGVLFFANQLKLVHDAYEAFLNASGLALKEILNEKEFFLPIVHAKTDFELPLHAGDQVEVQLFVLCKGTTSFTLSHQIYKGKIRAGHGETVHVSIAKQSGEKIPLPPELLEIL